MNRSLTIRTSISFAFLTGCALNFGQVNASGTANVTADTKIDTTVNASASVVQNGDGAQTTATPSPSVAPTEKPRGKLIVLQNFSDPNFVSYGGFLDFITTTPVTSYSIFLTAKEDNIPIKGITFTRIGWELFEDSKYFDVRLAVSNAGVVQVLSSLQNGTAPFSNENGLFIAPKDKTIEVKMGGRMYARNWSQQEGANYHHKLLGFSLKKMTDIRTDVPVDISGSFPLDGPLFKICCYSGDLTPNTP